MISVCVDVIIEDARWQASLDLEAVAQAAGEATLRPLDLDFGAEVALLATGDAQVAELNATHRDKAKATNVLSWPSQALASLSEGLPPPLPQADPSEPQTFLGDIALAYETCLQEAEEGQKALKDHVTHLIVHGILHLLGYDHETEGDADLMEGLEVAILADLGIASPYEESRK